MRAAFYSLALLLAGTLSANSHACVFDLEIDLDKEVGVRKGKLSDIKKSVNYLIDIYQDDVCIKFVNASFVQKFFIKLNFDIEKAKVVFINRSDDEDIKK